MKTTQAEKNNNICPGCNGPIAQDHKLLGYAKHLHRLPNGELCTHGKGERDSKVTSVVAGSQAPANLLSIRDYASNIEQAAKSIQGLCQ